MPSTGDVSPTYTVNAGSLITLDGSARYDSDGYSLTYLWTQISDLLSC